LSLLTSFSAVEYLSIRPLLLVSYLSTLVQITMERNRNNGKKIEVNWKVFEGKILYFFCHFSANKHIQK